MLTGDYGGKNKNAQKHRCAKPMTVNKDAEIHSHRDLSVLHAALEQQYGDGIIPLSALSMLRRWALALGRPCSKHINNSSKRVAHVLKQTSHSPSLRAEIEQELLYEVEAQDSPLQYMYNIPKVSFTSQPEQNFKISCCNRNNDLRHFSDSQHYTRSRAFYARQNARAFETTVPCGVTTNAFIVDAYARCIQAYLADIRHCYDNIDVSDRAHIMDVGNRTCHRGETAEQKHGLGHVKTKRSATASSATTDDSRSRNKVYVIELAAGHCLFGYLLAKRLHQAQEEGAVPSSWSICILLTDFNHAILKSRMEMPWMKPLMAAGLVEFAVLDAASAGASGPTEQEGEEGRERVEPGSLLLMGETKRWIPAGSLLGPVFIIGNYALDSFPVDVFMSGQTGGLDEVCAEGGGGRLRLVPVPLTATSERAADGYPYQPLVRALVEEREGGVLHMINVGFIRVLEQIRSLLHPRHKGHIAAVAADATFQFDDPVWRVEQAGSEGSKVLDGIEEGDRRGLAVRVSETMEQKTRGRVHEVTKCQDGEKATQHHVAPSSDYGGDRKTLQRPPSIELPDISPGSGSGCFALAVDPQTIVSAVLWTFQGLGEGDGRRGEERVEWLAVRNTLLEGGLAVTLVAMNAIEEDEVHATGNVALSRTREAFWRHLCLQNPTDYEHIQGLMLEEHDALKKGGRECRSLVSSLGLQGMLALLRWSGYDFDLFWILRWYLRDAMLQHCSFDRQLGAGRLFTDETMKEYVLVVADVALRCLSNCTALTARAWALSRYRGLQFLYALGCYREAVEFFMYRCRGDMSPLKLSTSSIDLWRDEFCDEFESAAEAFLIALCLDKLPCTSKRVRQLLLCITHGARFRDSKGLQRVTKYLHKHDLNAYGGL